MPDERIVTILLAEAERALRMTPAQAATIVENAYHKLIAEHEQNLTEDQRTELTIARLLLEDIVNHALIQVDVVKQLLHHPTVQRWGKRNHEDWTKLSQTEWSNRLMDAFARNGALRDARIYVNEVGTPVEGSELRYDVPDKQALQDHLQKIFLNSLRGDQ